MGHTYAPEEGWPGHRGQKHISSGEKTIQTGAGSAGKPSGRTGGKGHGEGQKGHGTGQEHDRGMKGAQRATAARVSGWLAQHAKHNSQVETRMASPAANCRLCR